jgi:ATP-dependent phosphoenolpyruvate carboxykinase
MVPSSAISGLKFFGITNPVRKKLLKMFSLFSDCFLQTEIYHNLNLTQLHQHEVANNEGYIIDNGTFAVDTGKFTGRSPNDKWIVQQSPSSENLWWGPVNQPISPYVFDELFNLAVDHYNTVEKVWIEKYFLFISFFLLIALQTGVYF